MIEADTADTIMGITIVNLAQIFTGLLFLCFCWDTPSEDWSLTITKRVPSLFFSFTGMNVVIVCTKPDIVHV